MSLSATLAQQKLLKKTIAKEENLRFKWFKRYEQKLVDAANKEPQRKVPDEVKEEMKQRILKNATKPEVEDMPSAPLVEEAAIYNVMRPVEKEVKDLLYKSVGNEGRKIYLHERAKKMPEHRYYFPETTNFRYGWNMFEYTKNIKCSSFGRQQVINDNFYRRRATVSDPEWYKEPARLSPQICGRI